MTIQIAKITSLSNRYFAIRHGQSEANLEHIILSNPADGTTSYGLTAVGRDQVRSTVLDAQRSGLFSVPPVIYSSDFLRACDTADIASSLLGTAYTPTPRLRERFFGRLDKTGDENYRRVWKDDGVDPNHHHLGVESVMQVLKRMTALVADSEQLHRSIDIIFISHGDPLQILQAGLSGFSPGLHRRLPHLDLAEIRLLR